MAETWIPDAARLSAHRFGEHLPALPSAVVWVSSGDGSDWSALQVAQRCNRAGRQPHLIWDPRTDDLVQMIPTDHGHRLYGAQSPVSGLLAVLVITETPLALQGRERAAQTRLGAVLAGLGIPHVWPFGPPYIDAIKRTPTERGWYDAAQVRST